jgi:hypothetical protein
MTPDQIIREEFERWASDDGRLSSAIERTAANYYRLPTVRAQWLAWQAAWAVATGYAA